jgi:CBS domain-containing protein
MTVADTLNETPVSDLDLSRHVVVSDTDPVSETIESMSDAGYSCALVATDGELVGIFTQRDVLMRVVGEPGAAAQPISELMTESPRSVGSRDSVAEALAIMNELYVRSVPVLDDGGAIRGNVSYYVLMKLIAELLSDHGLGTPTEVSARHGLEFVDFTGLNTSTPVTVRGDDSLEVAVHHMKSRTIGSVFVVDNRDQLVGVVTEFDLQSRGAWREPDLSTRTVAEFMTPDPVALGVRRPIADAIQQMATSGFSHIPLLGETGRPVGVASFRDVADYFETSVSILE